MSRSNGLYHGLTMYYHQMRCLRQMRHLHQLKCHHPLLLHIRSEQLATFLCWIHSSRLCCKAIFMSKGMWVIPSTEDLMPKEKGGTAHGNAARSKSACHAPQIGPVNNHALVMKGLSGVDVSRKSTESLFYRPSIASIAAGMSLARSNPPQDPCLAGLWASLP